MAEPSPIQQEILDARAAVGRALENLMNLELGRTEDPVVVIDWLAGVEFVDATNSPTLRLSVSRNMTPWKAAGIAEHVASIAARVFGG
jgi:hypothetical protein